MSPRNPIDDFFRRRLKGHEEAPPMHLWQSIAEQRDRRQRNGRRRRLLTGGGLLALAIAAGWWLLPAPTIPLQSFPIPLPGEPPALDNAAHAEAAPLARLPAVRFPLRPKQTPEVPAVRPATLSPAGGALPESPASGENTLADQSGRRTHSPVPPVRSLPPAQPILFEREPQCVRFGEQQQWRLFADAFGGPAFAFRAMEARTPVDDAYAHARIDTERPRLSYTAGLRLSIVSDFGLAVRTGLQYTQFNEKFDYRENREEKITITNVYGPNGDFIRTDTIVEKSVQHLQANNRYRMLDLPILLGYEWRRNKWTVAFNGGALINVLFSSEGQFLDPEDQRPAAFSSNARDNSYQVYRTNIGLGWYAGIGLHYQLRKDLQLLLEPHLRVNPQSISRNDFPLEQRYLSTGLSIGLRKQI